MTLLLTRSDVAALLTLDDCIAAVEVFDSTGVAIEDVAAAAAVYEKAVRAARGVTVDLAG